MTMMHSLMKLISVNAKEDLIETKMMKMKFHGHVDLQRGHPVQKKVTDLQTDF